MKKSTPWLPHAGQCEASRLRLFCFSYAGGGTAVFQRWRTQLAPQIEVCPVLTPGREGRFREDCIDDFDTMVSHIITAITPWLDQPFAFYGHSMGSLLAHAITQQLRKKHLPKPLHLFVAAHRAPHLKYRFPSVQAASNDRVVAWLNRFQGIPEAILDNEDIMKIMLPRLRADLAVCESFQYRDTDVLDCPITAFSATEDTIVTNADIADWHTHTRAEFELIEIEGPHLFIRDSHNPCLSIIQKRLLSNLLSKYIAA